MGFKDLTAALTLFTLVAATQSAQAKVYEADLERSSWQLQSSPFACRLTHPIPEFGSAVLEREAGSPIRFWFEPMQMDRTLGDVRIYTERPAWLSGGQARLVSSLEVRQPIPRLEVDQAQAPQVLTALEQGLRPTLRVNGGATLGLAVGASPANFQVAYDQYLDCVAQLLPVNYDQIARTAILYPPAQWELSQASKQRLDLVYEYAKTDDRITRIYVDGHSDSSGRRLINRDLSRKRAEAVSEYLTNLGMNEEMLVTRYHGERYPVVPNNTADNRTRNRRVTIRLEREG